jgi:hypothetical protein
MYIDNYNYILEKFVKNNKSRNTVNKLVINVINPCYLIKIVRFLQL